MAKVVWCASGAGNAGKTAALLLICPGPENEKPCSVSEAGLRNLVIILCFRALLSVEPQDRQFNAVHNGGINGQGRTNSLRLRLGGGNLQAKNWNVDQHYRMFSGEPRRCQSLLERDPLTLRPGLPIAPAESLNSVPSLAIRSSRFLPSRSTSTS